MNIRLTPLNIVSALCLVGAALMLMQERKSLHVNMPGFFASLCVGVAVVAFLSDLLFRRLVPNIHKLWVIEVMVVIFMVITTYILIASI